MCEWEPIGLDMGRLVECLMDIGPYDEPPTPDTKDDTSPPPVEEDTKDDEFMGENKLMEREDGLAGEHIKEGNPREEPSVEYEPDEDSGEDAKEEPLEDDNPQEDLMEDEDLAEDPEEDPEEEPLEGDDPEDDPMEEDDPEEDPKEDPEDEPLKENDLEEDL